jgi:hypothetical protein
LWFRMRSGGDWVLIIVAAAWFCGWLAGGRDQDRLGRGRCVALVREFGGVVVGVERVGCAHGAA